MEKLIKNLEHAKPLPLKEQVAYEPGRVVSLTPVSYTHLDVYKRQVQTTPTGRRRGKSPSAPSGGP